MYNKFGGTIKSQIKKLLPEVKFYDGKYYFFGQEMFSKIHKNEIPVELLNMDSLSAANKDNKIQIWKECKNIEYDYYKTPQNDVLCFQKNILVQIM